jgi:hypothetical protein
VRHSVTPYLHTTLHLLLPLAQYGGPICTIFKIGDLIYPDTDSHSRRDPRPPLWQEVLRLNLTLCDQGEGNQGEGDPPFRRHVQWGRDGY